MYRIFKKKRGLYYWWMLLGTWGCVIDSIAVILRFFVPNSAPLWPLYTLFILAGWTIYAPAQLLVLYSRLHLINQSPRLHRWVLTMIIVVSSLMIIPTWVLVWPAYNPYNHHLSSLYSPREAIVDRCTQLGYTIAESVLSGIYIWSLTKLLSLKSSVRQRRVMTDLIYVNVIAVCFDILTVVLVYLNETGISHPIQTFSYILKLKLEFMVLNQLMAVAARGVQKETFAERRYHHPSTSGGKGSSAASSKTPRLELESSRLGLESVREPSREDSVREIVMPSPTLSRIQGMPNGSDSQSTHDHAEVGRWPVKAKVKKHGAKRAGDDAEEEEDEEIGVHMWDKRGNSMMVIPWFQTEGRA